MIGQLWNAKLQRIDAPMGADLEGRPLLTEGGSIDVRCVIDAPSRAQLMTLGARLTDLSAVLYVLTRAMPAGADLKEGYRLLVQPWDRAADRAVGPATLYEAMEARPMPGDELSHYQVMLKGV